MATKTTVAATSVTDIAASLKIDPKRARRILRKREDVKHELGASWSELNATQAKKITAILKEATAA